MKKFFKTAAGYGLSMLGFLGCAAVLGGAIAGNVAVGVCLTPWLLILSIPAGVALVGLAMAAFTKSLDLALGWADS